MDLAADYGRRNTKREGPTKEKIVANVGIAPVLLI